MTAAFYTRLYSSSIGIKTTSGDRYFIDRIKAPNFIKVVSEIETTKET